MKTGIEGQFSAQPTVSYYGSGGYSGGSEQQAGQRGYRTHKKGRHNWKGSRGFKLTQDFSGSGQSFGYNSSSSGASTCQMCDRSHQGPCLASNRACFSATQPSFPSALGYSQGGSQFLEVGLWEANLGAEFRVRLQALSTRVLLDPGTTHSFISPSFALRLDVQPIRLQVPMSVTTLLSDALETDVVFPLYPVSVEGRDLVANLILLNVIDFDIILEMDWLAMRYAMLDCREKKVTFQIPGDSEFLFKGEQVATLSNLMSAITARRMLYCGCQGYLGRTR
eukprot:XP_015571912.1 uncharacterized protein LOC107260899 [Ricinus communis]